MEGENRHLDRKGNKKANEQKVLHVGESIVLGDQLRQSKCMLGRSHIQNRQQHKQGAGHRIEEELNRSINAPLAAPHADQEIHGDQREFPEDVEQEKILGQENTQHTNF